MGLGYPPPTRSRLAPLWADAGGSRSVGFAWSPEPGREGVDQVSRVERSTTWSTPGPRRARAPADAIQGGRVARVGTSAAESRNGGPVGAFPIFDV